jgi:four helix bundle protein
MTNDECRKNDEARMTNNGDSASQIAEEEFWRADTAPETLELHEDARGKPVYDLEERTARFGEAVILFAKKIPESAVNYRLISQLVGAATSIGANYCEADDGVSKKDFKVKIGTCKKESRESKFFLRMVATSEPDLKPQARPLWQEAKELHLIFCAIWRRS